MKDIIKRLRSLFDVNNIDGYIIPKNDEFFPNLQIMID